MHITAISARRKGICALQTQPPSQADPAQTSGAFDGTQWLLDSELLQERRVEVGQCVDEKTLLKLAAASALVRAKRRALWHLSRADTCSGGLKQKLLRDFPEQAAQAAVDRMTQLGYIDDARYAARLAQTLLAEKRLPARAAVMKMTQKGLPRALAQAAVDAVEIEPAVQILELLEKKYKSRLATQADVQKTVAALARRGFSFSDIRAALRVFKNDDTATRDFLDDET